MLNLEQQLCERLEREALPPVEVKDGMVDSLLLTVRQFIRRRLGSDYPTEYIDLITHNLISDSFAAAGVSVTHPTLDTLQVAQTILDKQLGLQSEPDLMDHHRSTMIRLFDLARNHTVSAYGHS